jgi:tripartite-type tricarboxylate transporter receptor subunit TctC
VTIGLRILFFALLALVLATVRAGAADDATARFYTGRRVDIVVGTGPGGGYDVYARLIARYLGRHIPGRPTIVVVNMPGASSLNAANYVANVAPRDGATLFLPVQTLPLTRLAGNDKARFDLARFGWIGNMSNSANTVFAWGSSPVKTFADAQKYQTTMGATTPDSLGGIYPAVMNAFLDTKFQIINGYESGDAVDLALERGEVAGRAGVSWAGLKSYRADWLRDGKIHIFAQVGIAAERDLDAPLLTDLAKNDAQRRALQFYSSLVAVGRALATGPDTPPERVAALRDAFDAAMADPDLQAEAAKERLELRPLAGARVQEAVNDMTHADPHMLDLVREAGQSAKSR